MTPDQWNRIKELFASARERAADERSAFLEQACAGDELLRREVQSLLAAFPEAESFLETPPVDVTAEALAGVTSESAVGQVIGHYQVTGALGSGGMGEVYLAQDTRLGRSVALKLLPTYFTQDEHRLRRFGQEARAASALNHPNVCVIHEIGETEAGQPYIAMEYIDGVTLRQHLTGARLPLSEVLEVAVQVASGLAAAHEAGIVHRDIKPENLMLRRDGYVKVLDFGLAKLTEQEATDAAPPAGARLKTDTGVVMGTSSYMSPEQARGLPVDGRTDIWSLGVVLYEMITGEVPFKGETTSDVIVSILEREPSLLAQLSPIAPAELQRIISKSLDKDREGRYQTTKDLLSDLKSLKDDLELEAKFEHSLQPGSRGKGKLRRSATVSAARAQTGWWANRWIWLSVVILVVGVAVWLNSSNSPFGRFTRSRSESLLPMKVVPFTSLAGYEGSPAFSPDGNQIAFNWDGETGDNTDIYVKFIDDAGTPLRLTTHPGIDQSPTWSPDGRQIAFARFSESEKGIFTVSALGGTERKLYSPDWVFPAFAKVVWSPDGKFLAYLDRSSPETNYGIWLLSVENLERRQLTWQSEQSFMDMVPAFSPDGQTLAFVRINSSSVCDIYLVPIGGGEPRRLTFDNCEIDGLAWTPDGREVVFTSDREGGYALWKIPVTGGTPERLAVGGSNDFSPPLSPQGNRLAMSRQGNHLAYVRTLFDTNIWRIEMPETKGRSNPPTKLIASTNLDQGPQYSPDGKRIVFESTRSGSYEIWMCDSNGTNLVQLTSFGRVTGTPRWSPDGRNIAFDSRIETHSDIYVTGAEGGSPRRLTTETSNDMVPSWSRDGRWIYFASDRSGDTQVWKVPAEGGQAVQVTKQGGFASFESPDGKFVYYTALKAPGIWRVAVGGGEEVKVLDQPRLGYWGCWAVVNEGIYFINTEVKQHPVIEFFSFATRRVRRIAAMEKEAVLGSPGFAISPDGRSILYAQVDQSGGDIILVENFR